MASSKLLCARSACALSYTEVSSGFAQGVTVERSRGLTNQARGIGSSRGSRLCLLGRFGLVR